jgi:vancomycin resistance protein YoaR
MNQTNTNILITAIPLLLLGVFLATAPHALAAPSTGSSNPISTAPVSIPAAQAQNWQGNYEITEQSTVKNSPINLSNLMRSHFGWNTTAKTIQTTPRLVRHNPAAVYQWLKDATANISVTPQEPSLEIKNGRAINFKPPHPGQQVDLYQTTLAALQNLERGQYQVTPIVKTAAPRTSLKELNDNGINELISRGVSTFHGSPKNRRHNIKIGVAKMKGIIVKQGEEFSFNKYLGPVEAYAGFLPELVIRADKGTVPELGGGLCQVSSTAFRSAMHAGLPITQRRNHSYAVQYYAPQGTDATIYPGVIDLKFVNDTPGDILIWPYFPDDNTLIFDFYGAKDGRVVKLEDPVQYDRKPDGSMKAYWIRTVIKDGKTDRVTFNSVYKPPALFHRQETFVNNPQAPNATPSKPTDAPTQPAPTTPNAPAPQPGSTGSNPASPAPNPPSSTTQP